MHRSLKGEKMNRERKKAHRRNDAPQHQTNHIKSFWICLILFVIFFACMVAGKAANNVAIEFFGIGVGFALLLFTTNENLKEDEK